MTIFQPLTEQERIISNFSLMHECVRASSTSCFTHSTIIQCVIMTTPVGESETTGCFVTRIPPQPACMYWCRLARERVRWRESERGRVRCFDSGVMWHQNRIFEWFLRKIRWKREKFDRNDCHFATVSWRINQTIVLRRKRIVLRFLEPYISARDFSHFDAKFAIQSIISFAQLLVSKTMLNFSRNWSNYARLGIIQYEKCSKPKTFLQIKVITWHIRKSRLRLLPLPKLPLQIKAGQFSSPHKSGYLLSRGWEMKSLDTARTCSLVAWARLRDILASIIAFLLLQTRFLLELFRAGGCTLGCKKKC